MGWPSVSIFRAPHLSEVFKYSAVALQFSIWQNTVRKKQWNCWEIPQCPKPKSLISVAFMIYLIWNGASKRMDCHIKTKKEKILRRKIAKSFLKNRLFKFRSHPHGDFGIWHLFRMHNMVAETGAHHAVLPTSLRRIRLRSPRGSDSHSGCHSIPLGRSLCSLPSSHSPFGLITRWKKKNAWVETFWFG